MLIVWVVLDACDCEESNCWGHGGVAAVYENEQTARQHAERGWRLSVHKMTMSSELPEYLRRSKRDERKGR